MAFNIADILSESVSNLDTGAEQIEYISLDKLKPDKNNFYELSGIKELADNIATIGLQQPLRVRPEGDGFTVVTGHRRREAALLLREDGSDMFDNGIACIVERDDISSSLQELRLIFANSANRVLSVPELSRQAERVEILLYQLQEEGYEFPGRMRDHVAEACNISKSKLARLHAIRANLTPGLLRRFDDNKLAEATAYELQKLPEDAQMEIDRKTEKRGAVSMNAACNATKYLDQYINPNCSCKDGQTCDHVIPRIVKTAVDMYGYEYCPGGCCKACRYRSDCSFKCSTAKADVERERNATREKEAARKAEEQTRNEARYNANKRSVQEEAQRFEPLIKGFTDDTTIPGTYITAGTVRKYAAGEFSEKETFYTPHEIVRDYSSVENLRKLSGALKCSVDYLLGMNTANVSDLDTGCRWTSEGNAEDGLYYVKLQIEGTVLKQVLTYARGDWYFGNDYRTKLDSKAEVLGWYKLPED